MMNRIISHGEGHQTYKGLPPLAGIATIPEAMKTGRPWSNAWRASNAVKALPAE